MESPFLTYHYTTIVLYKELVRSDELCRLELCRFRLCCRSAVNIFTYPILTSGAVIIFLALAGLAAPRPAQRTAA